MIPLSFSKAIRDRRLQKGVMILCFIYAVLMAVLFSYQVYTFTLKSMQPAPGLAPNPGVNQAKQPQRDDIFRGISNDSPAILCFSLIGMIVSSLAGLALYGNTFVTEREEIKVQTIKGILLPDEQKIITLLEENTGELTQNELVIKSELSKLKVSRILQKLETRGVIKKHQYGKTNKVILKQE